MHALPALNALRAFEAAARQLSLEKAAKELNVSPSAISHQIRALEALLGVDLFERRARAIALTQAGKLLYPGIQTGFHQIREAVAGLRNAGNELVLVVSTPPGLTSKWLAPRLYRFANEHPDIETRISSSFAFANFATDGVDVAVRCLACPPGDKTLLSKKLVELSVIPVCSPRLIERHGPLHTPDALARVPLIHDDTLAMHAGVPTWADWFATAGVDGVNANRGLRFNSADHALDAANEGAGVLLSHDLLAYDDLRTGRLVSPVALSLPLGRGYYLVCPKRRQNAPQVRAFGHWIEQELALVDWKRLRG